MEEHQMEDRMETQEIQDKDCRIQALREMENHPGWRLFLVHLEELCRQKEVVKSRAVRTANQLGSLEAQFHIDGIRLAVSELSRLISSLSPKTEME